MTILEAYALGKPVIGANIGGIPEIIPENTTGFIFQSRDVDDLARVMEKAEQMNERDYNEMSFNARNLAETNFGEAAHYSKLIEIYSQTINNA